MSTAGASGGHHPSRERHAPARPCEPGMDDLVMQRQLLTICARQYRRLPREPFPVRAHELPWRPACGACGPYAQQRSYPARRQPSRFALRLHASNQIGQRERRRHKRYTNQFYHRTPSRWCLSESGVFSRPYRCHRERLSLHRSSLGEAGFQADLRGALLAG